MWKDIKGYEGLYQVNEFGEVKNLKLDRLMKGTIKNGYVKVHLRKEGISKYYFVHRLVAEAFINNPDNLPQVNHKDEIKTNNNVNNLEWCDSKYNVNYGTARQRMIEKMSKGVEQYDLNGNLINTYKSLTEIKNQFGYLPCCISEQISGKQKTAYGYKWKYTA